MTSPLRSLSLRSCSARRKSLRSYAALLVVVSFSTGLVIVLPRPWFLFCVFGGYLGAARTVGVVNGEVLAVKDVFTVVAEVGDVKWLGCSGLFLAL
jgi:hypothetical protein